MKRHFPSTDKQSVREEFKPAWKRARDLPAFLDASASVSASTFGARRLPEIKALWNKALSAPASYDNAIMSQEPLKSSGGKTSSRHLRRRTTSHKSRHRHRFPDGKNNNDNDANKEEDMCLSRRSARKTRSNLCAKHETWLMGTTEQESIIAEEIAEMDTDNNAEPPTGNKNAIHWMKTHLWHAKRFHMADLWGWQIPMVHTNRGPKAALRLIREGKTLLQDVTWKMTQPIHIAISNTHSAESIVKILQRICPEFYMNNNSERDNQRSSTGVYGQGMVYAVDAFPKHALGPITWFVSYERSLMGETCIKSSLENDSCHYHLYFWVHPMIQLTVLEQFKALQEDSPTILENMLQLGFQKNGLGMAYLQLRGIHATRTVQAILAEEIPPAGSQTNSLQALQQINNQQLLIDSDYHTKLSHGTIMPASANVTDSGMDDVTNESKEKSRSSTVAFVEGTSMLLISQRCRDPTNLLQNAPAIGWDIICDARTAKTLFLNLVLAGQACPIGIVEEAYVQLECDPPIASVFPRDFPETELGRDYWNRAATEAYSEDLQVLRMCLEQIGTGGRVHIPLIKERVRSPPPKQRKRTPKVSTDHLCSIQWERLVTADECCEIEESDVESAENEEEVVVMRGMFGRPLVEALAGSGVVPPREDPSKANVRKRRRRAKQPDELRRPLPLSTGSVEKHLAKCTALLQSLSLPAVVACHVQVIGHGIVHPGSEIYFCEDDDSKSAGIRRLLGYTTAGCFSVTRGCSHGIGVVGAGKLLKAILWVCAKTQQSNKSLAVFGSFTSDGGDRRQIRLQVLLKTGQICRKGVLALLH